MAGTREGALLGWETRRRNGNAPPKKGMARARKTSGKAARQVRPLQYGKRPLEPKINFEPERFDPYIKPGQMGRELLRTYGKEQIRQALSAYSNDKLSDMARDYGLRPAKTKRENLSQIVRYLTGKPRR